MPFAGADQPGQGIEGQDPLGALVAGIVKSEGGAEALEQHAGGGMVAVQFLDAQGAQGGDQGLESLPGFGAATEIFVVALAGLIGGEHGCPGEAEIMLSDRDDPGLRCYGTLLRNPWPLAHKRPNQAETRVTQPQAGPTRELLSEQEIALGHGQHLGRLTGEQLAVGEHLVGLGIDLHLGQGAVVAHGGLTNGAGVLHWHTQAV